MDINSAISDKMMGGECLAGLKLEIAVFDPGTMTRKPISSMEGDECQNLQVLFGW